VVLLSTTNTTRKTFTFITQLKSQESRGFGRKQKNCQSCDWPLLKTREPPIFPISKIEVPHWTSQDNAGVKHGSKPAPPKTNRSEVHRKNPQISPNPTNPQLPGEGWWKIGSLCKSLKNRWWVTCNVYKSPYEWMYSESSTNHLLHPHNGMHPFCKIGKDTLWYLVA